MFKKLLQQPWPDWRLVRVKRWIELLLRLSSHYGLFESAWKGVPLISNKHVPWISFPAIEFLDMLIDESFTVLEYGSGSSTIWLAKRCKKVYSVESVHSWVCKVNEALVENGIDNAIVYEETDGAYSKFPLIKNGLPDKYDLVVIDGLIAERMRYECFEVARHLLTERGVIVIDNIDWLGYTRKVVMESEFYCIPFMGSALLVPYSTTTLIAFRDPRILHDSFYVNKLVSSASPINGLNQDFEYGC